MLPELPGWLCYASAVTFAGAAGYRLLCLPWVKRLPPLQDLPTLPTPPKVSVIIAARDEAKRVGTTIERLLQQRGVEIEIVVVDDRSTDNTSAVVSQWAAKDSRVKSLRVEVLPAGWLGKCHACHVAARHATGEWLLFTDADVWMQLDTVLRAVLAGHQHGVEHVTLMPGINEGTSRFERAWHLLFSFSVMVWMARVNRDRRGAYLGMGAFNLVQAEIYHACGGHEALKLTVLDDVKLGLLVRRAGGRIRAYLGGKDTECHWSATPSGMIKITEKNFFAALEYRLERFLGLMILVIPLWLAGVLGPFTGTIPGLLAGMGLLSLALPTAVVAARLGWRKRIACLVPFLIPVMLFAIANSVIVTLRRGGVRWRDTFYSLAELRKGNLK